MSLKDILHPKTTAGSLIRDIVIVLLVVALIGIVLFAVSGTWPALVAVESGSMEPNISTYSLAFVVEENRFGGWQTQEEALASGANKIFNGYGDVIVYQPNGISGVTPIIHRAITTITADEAATVWNFTGDAAHAGVITKGDNPITNSVADQKWQNSKYGGRIQPVKPEWIVGKAIFAIPLIGWVPLNIIPSILVVFGIVIIIEISSHFIVKRKEATSANRRNKRNRDRKKKRQ